MYVKKKPKNSYFLPVKSSGQVTKNIKEVKQQISKLHYRIKFYMYNPPTMQMHWNSNKFKTKVPKHYQRLK